jgi:hypothetical protein
MNTRPPVLRLIAASAFLSIATAASAQEPQRVAVKTAGLSPFVAKAVEEKAAQGVGELRRYVERTRMIRGLYIPDIVREDDAAIEQARAVPAEEAPVVAQRQAPATKVAAEKAPKSQLARNTKAAPVQQLALASRKSKRA